MVSRPRAGRLLVCVWWIATASGAAHLLWYTGTGTGSTNRSITSNSFGNVRIVANNTALGSTAAGTTVSNTAALQFDGSGGNLTVGEALTFNTTNTNGGLRNLAGTNTLTGLVTLQANFDYRNNGGRLVVDGGITTANNSGISFNGAATIQTVAANLGTGTLSATSSNEANAIRIEVAGNTWSLARISFSGYVRTGVDNALPASAGVEFGWSTDDFSAGTLDLDAADSISTAGTIRIGAGATLDTALLSSFALGSQPLTFGLDPAGSGSAGLLDAAGLDVSLASLGFDLAGTLDDNAYVFANYTPLTGSFASTSLPTGYTLDYDYQGNSQIALVAVPEPGQLLLGGFGLAALGGWLSADGGLRAAIAEGCLLGVRHPAAAEDQRPRGCLRASFRGFGWGSCHRWPPGPERHDEVVDEQLASVAPDAAQLQPRGMLDWEVFGGHRGRPRLSLLAGHRQAQGLRRRRADLTGQIEPVPDAGSQRGNPAPIEGHAAGADDDLPGCSPTSRRTLGDQVNDQLARDLRGEPDVE